MAEDSSEIRDDKHDLIIKLLSDVGRKLQKSEMERKALWEELKEYRSSLSDIEDKANRMETAYIKVGSNKGNHLSNLIADEIKKRQAEIEAKTKELADKIEKTSQQSDKTSKRFEKLNQERARLYRRIEKAEEVAEKAKEAVESKALVVLTDMAASKKTVNDDSLLLNNSMIHNQYEDSSWWRRSVRMSAVTAVSIFALSVMAGVGVSNIISGGMSGKIAVIDYDSFAKLNMDEKSWHKIADISPSDMEYMPDEADLSEDKEIISLAKEDEEVIDELTSKILASPEKGEGAEIILHEAGEEETEKATENIKIATNDKIVIDNKKNDKNSNLIAEEKSDYALDPKLTASFAKAVVEEAKVEKQLIEKQKKLFPIEERISPDKDLPEIIKQVEAKAFEGVAEAQHDLAAIYIAGHAGVEQNYDRAIFWFKEAAARNIANARYNLGVLYHQGLGINQDIDEAIKWYRAASHLGHPEARYNLGIAHIEGIGTSYDPVLAAAYFEKAAAGGVMEAAYNLGLIYENGLLGKPRKKLAVFWYKYAKELGSVDAETAFNQLVARMDLSSEDVEKIVNDIYKNKPILHQNLQIASAKMDTRYSETVKQIQDRLKIMGIYSGISDGILGPKTEEAIMEYQKISGIKMDGKANDNLLVHMLAEEMQYATLPAAGDKEEGSTP